MITEVKFLVSKFFLEYKPYIFLNSIAVLPTGSNCESKPLGYPLKYAQFHQNLFNRLGVQ